MSGIGESCGLTACCASLWAGLSACYSNMSGGGCGGGTTCALGATCDNICNYMNCCNRTGCCNQTSVQGGNYVPTEMTVITNTAGGTDGGVGSDANKISNAATRALDLGSAAVAANSGGGVNPFQVAPVAPPATSTAGKTVVIQQPSA